MASSDTPFYIVGHRGAAGERLENSLEGFRHALGLDIDAIELDIHQHGDELWVFHDHDLSRLTTSSGLFKDHPDPGAIELNNGETIPSLRQVLDLYWGEMPVNVEIKSVANPGLLLELLSEYGPLPAPTGLPWIFISSFNHQSLLRLRELECPWPLSPLSSGIPLQFAPEIEQLAPYSWHFDDDYVDADQVTFLRKQGIASLVYTVNDVERARFLRAKGVAGIFTDYPTEMRAQLSR